MDESDIDNEAVQLTVGSDDEFAADNQDDRTSEPGELVSSSEEDNVVGEANRVKSKVVKLPRIPRRQVKGSGVDQPDKVKVGTSGQDQSKFNHLCHDPDFRKFLNEMMDERGKKGNFDGR